MDDTAFARFMHGPSRKRNSGHDRSHNTWIWTISDGDGDRVYMNTGTSPVTRNVWSSFDDLLGPHSFFQPTRRRHATVTNRGLGLFDTAFAMLDGLHVMQEEERLPRRRGRRSSPVRSSQAVDDDDLFYGPGRRTHPDKLRSESSRSRDGVPSSRRRREFQEPSNPYNASQERKYRIVNGAGRAGKRTYAPASSPRERTKKQHVHVSDEEEDYDDGRCNPDHERSSETGAYHAARIAELERQVEQELASVTLCQHRLQQALNRPAIAIRHLQKLAGDVRECEAALDIVRLELRRAKRAAEFDGREQQTPHLPGHRRRRTSQDRGHPSQGFDQDHSGSRSGRRSMPFSGKASDAHPWASMFEEFDRLHHMFNRASFRASNSPAGTTFSFFDLPGNANEHSRSTNCHHYTRPEAYFRSRHTNSTAYFPTPQPTRPHHIFPQAQEAKQLFQAYTARWNALSNSDPNIPFPTRDMSPMSLLVPESIYAPFVQSGVETWSSEQVMQANAQAFFLGAVGLHPTYSETAGRITMGYDKLQATTEQVQELINILKREKMRWHSDRLGRRTGGQPGVNEVLQRDDRARAVFHAVCELMAHAQDQ